MKDNKQNNQPHRREQIKEVEISEEEESRKIFSAEEESEGETEVPLVLEEEMSEEGAAADAPTEILIPTYAPAEEPAPAFKPFRPRTLPPRPQEDSEALDTGKLQPPKPVSAKAGVAAPEEDPEWTGNFALPPGVYAHFLLIDIKAPVKQIRKTPRFFPVKNIRTLIGRTAKAHVRLDDPRTVEVKHAKLVLEEKEGRRDFVLYPLNLSRVAVNGKFLPRSGVTLKNGDRIKIGSADLIFFACDLLRK